MTDYFSALRSELVAAGARSTVRTRRQRRNRLVLATTVSLSVPAAGVAVAAGWTPFTTSDGITKTAPPAVVASGAFDDTGGWTLARTSTTDGECVEISFADPTLPHGAGGCGPRLSYQHGVIAGSTLEQHAVVFGAAPSSTARVRLVERDGRSEFVDPTQTADGRAYFVLESADPDLTGACLVAEAADRATLHAWPVHGEDTAACQSGRS